MTHQNSLVADPHRNDGKFHHAPSCLVGKHGISKLVQVNHLLPYIFFKKINLVRTF